MSHDLLYLLGLKSPVSSLIFVFPGTLRWSKTWTDKLVSLACNALLHFCEATTLWNASPGKGLELCLILHLLSGTVGWHCYAQSSSEAETEGFHSRQKSYNLMAINIFSWYLGRLPSRCRDICMKILRSSTVLGNTGGYLTITHCKVSDLNHILHFYCK